MGCGFSNIPSEYDYCFKEMEISHILQLKKEKEGQINNGTVEGGNNLHLLYRKIEFDLTKKFLLLKEYLVLYIPKNYSKDTAIYEFLSHVNNFLVCHKGTDFNQIAKKIMNKKQ